MSWVAVGVGVAGIAMSAFSSSQQADAAEDAQNANLAAARETNRLNYQMFQEGRGSEGSAFLPLYALDAEGNPVEPELFADALRAYRQTGNLSDPQTLRRYRAFVDAMQPTQDAANNTVTGLFSGQRADQQVQNAQPVFEARTNLAKTRKNAALESLKSTINEIKATKNRQGFAGDSSGNRMLRTNATRDINTQAATEIGNARLLNAQDEANIRNRDLDLRLQNLHLPNAMVQQGINIDSAPEVAFTENQNRRLGGMNFFRIGTDSFRNNPLPQVQPIANTGQIAGEAASAALSGFGNYWTNRQLTNQINQQQPQTPTIYSSPMDAMRSGT